jgi:ELWxxDGT repeat protein
MRLPRHIRLFLERLEDRTVPATVVQEVKAINPGNDSEIGYSTKGDDFASLHGTLFFPAFNGVSVDLWESNGTAGGTYLVKQIDPFFAAQNYTYPSQLTTLGDSVYFIGYDGSNLDLWKTDSSAAGTVEAIQNLPPPVFGDYYSLQNAGGNLYIRGVSQLGTSLMRSDGTAAGTTTFFTGNNFFGTTKAPGNLTAVGGSLFFTYANQLYKSDGTSAGTVLVKDINSSAADSTLGNLTAVGNTLFFTADDGTHGGELWESDATAAGSVLVKDINPGAASSASQNLTAVGNTLFFTATDGTHGVELWKSDGTAAGTVMVKDINPGATGSNPSDLTVFNGGLYFAANDGTDGRELWRSDGTAAGTVLVKDINVGGNDSNPTSLTVVGSTLFFSANDSTHGVELWQTDGTSSGTSLAYDILPGPTSSNPKFLTAAGSALFFTAMDSKGGRELWAAFPQAPPPGAGLQPVSKIGVVRPTAGGAAVSLDSNGDGAFDSGDQVFNFGLATDTFIIGDWNRIGYESIGVVRPTPSGVAQFTLDSNGNNAFDSGDSVFSFGLNTDTFLTGDWNGSFRTKIGVVRPGPSGVAVFSLDTNGNGTFDAGDQVSSFGLNTDTFLVGDWNGSGKSEIGVVRPSPGGGAVFSLDTNGDGVFDAGDQVFSFGLSSDTFLIGDWNGDDRDKIGVVRTSPGGSAVFSLDTNGDGVFDAGDQVFNFGLATDHFLVGRWQPPPAAALMSAGGFLIGPPVSPLVLDPTFLAAENQAIAAWQQAGLDPPDLARLQNINYGVATLGGSLLGETAGNNVTLDATAAGHGWSATPAAQPGRVDLETALAHEMGHVLGLPDQTTQPDDLMFASLQPGVRKAPTAQDVDAVFGAMGR